MIKYWFRLSNLQNCLAADAYNVSQRLYIGSKTSWYSCVIELFEYFDINVNCHNVSKEMLKLFHSGYNVIWKKRILDNRQNLRYGNKLRTNSLF